MRWAGIETQQELHQVWPIVRPLIETALSAGQGEYSADDIFVLAASNLVQIYVIGEGVKADAVVVTCIESFPQKDVLTVLLGAGVRFAEWAPLVDSLLVSYARVHGLRSIRWIGRKGFERATKSLGYNAEYVVMCKDIPLEVLH